MIFIINAQIVYAIVQTVELIIILVQFIPFFVRDLFNVPEILLLMYYIQYILNIQYILHKFIFYYIFSIFIYIIVYIYIISINIKYSGCKHLNRF